MKAVLLADHPAASGSVARLSVLRKMISKKKAAGENLRLNQE